MTAPVRKAKTTKDIPEAVAAKARARKRQRELKALQDKTFAELTAEEKDLLLKRIAIRLGFIKPGGE